MASVVTVVSRFCYRSPTRPLFVAALVFLILITWKFLTAQPDANALMMHSKHGMVSEKRAQQQVHSSVHELHVPLQSPVRKQDSGKRLVNILENNDKTKKSKEEGKVYDDEEDSIDGKTSHNDLTTVKERLFETTKNQNMKNEKVYDEEEEVNTDIENQGIKEEEIDYEERKESLQVKADNAQQKSTKSKGSDLLQQLPNVIGTQQALYSMETINGSKIKPEFTNETNPGDFPVGEYNILLTLVNMSPTSDLATGMKKCLKSICRHSTIKLTVHVVVDDIGKMVVQDFFKIIIGKCRDSEVVYHDVTILTQLLRPITHVLQESFSSSSRSYFNQPIFFISTALYKVFPQKLIKVIMLDVDMRFLSDIKLLFDMFNNFKESTIMGIAHEQSPVYRHVLNSYRSEHQNTLLGGPPPNGVTGFNSGVILFDLDQMRKSTTYNSALNGEKIKELTSKYHFHGHLGDQDFFTLLSFEYPELFYVIPCSWNKQLCLYWKEHGYYDIFDLYANCSQPIHVYHGNCRTSIPNDDDEEAVV